MGVVTSGVLGTLAAVTCGVSVSSSVLNQISISVWGGGVHKLDVYTSVGLLFPLPCSIGHSKTSHRLSSAILELIAKSSSSAGRGARSSVLLRQ